MSKKLIPSTHYENLITSLQSTLTSGLLAAKHVLEYARLQTYWEVGRRIREVVDASSGELIVGEKLYQRISLDLQDSAGLQMSVDLISRAVQFYRNYPVFPQESPLTFTHYLALQRIKDPVVRRRIEKKAINQSMSAIVLREEIGKLVGGLLPATMVLTPSTTLPLLRGEPYIYIARSFVDVSGAKNVCIDCGFKIQVLADGSILKQKMSLSKEKARYVRILKESGSYDAHLAVKKRACLYTYAARVARVVDGDTLDVLIDVGFGIRIAERLRLKGINCPELKTPAGNSAQKFVKKQLSRCPLIIIRTKKAGMYGRWLADVFFLPQENNPFKIAAEGQYLNQLLLDEGMAKVY